MASSLPLPPSPPSSYLSFAVRLPDSCCHCATDLELFRNRDEPEDLRCCKVIAPSQRRFQASLASYTPRSFLVPNGLSSFTSTNKYLQPQVFFLHSRSIMTRSQDSASQVHVKFVQVRPLKAYQLLQTEADLDCYKTFCSTSLPWGRPMCIHTRIDGTCRSDLSFGGSRGACAAHCTIILCSLTIF